jgi:SAM-dependent methyltransferase
MTGDDRTPPYAFDESDRMDSTGPNSVREALAIHQAKSQRVLAAGDSNAIKELYVELGSLLESAVGTDLAAVPLLSFPEIGPVVADRLRDVDGPFLDAGCGALPTVALMLGVTGPSRMIVVLDIGLGIVRLARARTASAGIVVAGVVGDLEALPFREGAFAAAGCEDTIEHLPDDRAGLGELSRVLRPHGRLVLTTPNRTRFDVLRRRLSDLLRGRRLPPSAYYAASSHLREYTWRQMLALCSDAFVVRERTTVDWSGNYRAKIASRLARLRPFRFASRMIVLVLEPSSRAVAARSPARNA